MDWIDKSVYVASAQNKRPPYCWGLENGPLKIFVTKRFGRWYVKCNFIALKEELIAGREAELEEVKTRALAVVSAKINHINKLFNHIKNEEKEK